MRTVELEVDTRMAHPFEDGQDRRTAEHRRQSSDVPPQQKDFELGVALDEPVNKPADLGWPLVSACAPIEIDPSVEVPTDQHDSLTRLQHRFARQAEVVVCVDDHRGALRALDSPTVDARLQHGSIAAAGPIGLFLRSKRKLSCHAGPRHARLMPESCQHRGSALHAKLSFELRARSQR